MAEQQRNRENKDFVMYFRPFMDELTRMAGENYTAYKLFQLLCKNMDGTNALVISMSALSEIMQMSRQTISKAVKYLSENGWVCVMKSGTSNVYIVNPDVAWTSYADQKSTCSFQANVILSGTENAEYLKNPKATTHYKKVSDEFMAAVKANKENFDELAGQIHLEDVAL
jgi:DNA-binding transcriptional regulator GbsR (MarR family)